MSAVALIAPDRSALAQADAVRTALAKILPPAALITGPEGCRTYETDALTAYRTAPLAVVLPGSTEEVAAVLGVCAAHGVRVVPRGAGTSLCGGALPSADAVVLCLSRMAKVLEISPDARAITVEAGITNLAVSAAVAPLGFFYAPDPSSQLACTIGGNIAMNSGGAHCLKYGVTTNNLLGVTLVTMAGEVMRLGGMHAGSAGYDLMALVCGSEGQLGIVTEATLRILPLAEGARPMLVGFDDAATAGACVAAIIAAGIVPVAIEYMDRPAIKVCEDFAHAGYPLDVEALLLIEVEGDAGEIAALLARIEEIARRFQPRSLRISASDAESALIWKGRKAAFGAIGRIADYICMDGTIPLGRLPEVLTRIGEICAAKGLGVANIFHAGDGNLHPLVLFNANDAAQAAAAEAAGAEILALCVEVGGCLTGEHGVGIEKRELMPTQFSAAELSQMMRLKAAFDPSWRLNDGKVFPLASVAAFRAAAG